MSDAENDCVVYIISRRSSGLFLKRWPKCRLSFKVSFTIWHESSSLIGVYMCLDYSEDSSGRETPASGSSRQELEDGGKDKKKKTKKKKEKKTKTKKKDDTDDPDKKTKKKGFVLLR